MNNPLPTLQYVDFANVCAEHTRRVQLLSGQLWHGDIDMLHYRRRSRELTQQFVNELQVILNQNAG